MAYALAIVGWGLLVASEAVAADAEATEGDAIVFWVKKPEMGGLNSVVGETLRFSYRTMDRTATAGDDYLAVNGMLAFPPGLRQEVRSVKVDTLPDDVDEGSGEIFSLVLGDPEFADKICMCWKPAPAYLVPSRIVLTGRIVEAEGSAGRPLETLGGNGGLAGGPGAD
ncbi:MAG: hypothetical protein OXH79_17195 [Boseongicola sp.]|nr:hypothetical protein [Boseongicola sp.]